MTKMEDLQLWIALVEFDSVQFLSPVYTTKADSTPISKNLKPMIIILSKVEMLKDLCFLSG